MGVYFDNGHEAILGSQSSRQVSAETMQPLMRMVYLWMTVGLALTGIIAMVVTNAIVTSLQTESFQTLNTISTLAIPAFIVELLVVLGLQWGINRISSGVASGLFFFYAALNGLTIGIIVFSYAVGVDSRGVVTADYMPAAKAFFTTAGLFGTMSVIGYTTKVDLTRYSTFFGMALIGLLIASIVNIFLSSSVVSWAISVFGVLLFTALTAYDTQWIKNAASDPSLQEGEGMRKVAIIGALHLYLDFINLFIYLLRLFSRRN